VLWVALPNRAVIVIEAEDNKALVAPSLTSIKRGLRLTNRVIKVVVVVTVIVWVDPM